MALAPVTISRCLHSHYLLKNVHPSSSSNSFLYSFRPNKRFNFFKPSSSLRQTKKLQSLQKSPPNAPQSLRWFLNPKADNDDKLKVDTDGNGEGGIEGDTALKGTLLAGVLLVGVVGGFATIGYVYKNQINAFLNHFSSFIEGTWAYVSAGAFGRVIIESEFGFGRGNGILTLRLGLLATALAAAYVTQLVKDAVKDIQ